MTADKHGREYAKYSQLKAGDRVQVDDGFEGCLIPWSVLEVVDVNGTLAVAHNEPECGACGGGEGTCYHHLDGQLADDDSLIGIYPAGADSDGNECLDKRLTHTSTED